MRVILGLMLAVVCSAVAVQGARPASQTTQQPRLILESTDGRDLFDFYCASCHGRSGEGDGPVAPALSVQPSDLTRLAEQNSSVFPRQRVRATLIGTAVPATQAHGSQTMPVWGPIFRALDPDDQRLEVRIVSLLAYLESLQAK